MDLAEQKLPPKQKHKKNTLEELLNLEKEELAKTILRLEAHNEQLKGIINRNSKKAEKRDRSKPKKPFDFTKCHYRRVLLRIMYFGWNYQGFVVQEDTTQTVEHYLFEALTKACLIESREKSQYHRCGRTDKGVSAFGQVISISLRSKFTTEEQDAGSVKKEMPYCKILNRLLPKDIRAIAWMPIPNHLPEFSARFDCKKRTYRYYFPRSSLDVSAMSAACVHLIGTHDFRHLCKMDVANGVTTFVRDILSADIMFVDANDTDLPTSMCCLVMEGNAFLWHQIRSIMAILLLVGQGKESPDIIRELLDVEKLPRKPQYELASDVALNLYHCSYDLEDVNSWVYDRLNLKAIITQLQGDWTIQNIKSTMYRDVLNELEIQYASLGATKTKDTDGNVIEKDRILAHCECLIQGVRPRVYTPLLKRVTCPSLEERIEHYAKKRKINVPEKEQTDTQTDKQTEEMDL